MKWSLKTTVPAVLTGLLGYAVVFPPFPGNQPGATPPPPALQLFSESFIEINQSFGNCRMTMNQAQSYGATWYTGALYHKGYDFMCGPKGQPFDMKFLTSLTIETVGLDELYGNYLLAKLTDDPSIHFLFAHLNRVDVREGDVTRSQATVFQVGSTGNAYDVHLHMEIYRDGIPIGLDWRSHIYGFYHIREKYPLDARTVLKQLYARERGGTEDEADNIITKFLQAGREQHIDIFSLFSYYLMQSQSIDNFLHDALDNPEVYLTAKNYMDRLGLTDRDARDDFVEAKAELHDWLYFERFNTL